MSPKWRIDIRLGEDLDRAPLRTAVVEAPDEAEALRLTLRQAERDLAAAGQSLDDGQEEVFSRAEVETGKIEHRHESS
jgi:hypothetical protein